MSSDRIKRLVTASMLLAAALVLPFLTGQIPEIGNMLCPMHLPVLLCGFFCGPIYGLAVGAAAPLLRFLLFGMPPLFPTGVAMAVELAVYGMVSGMLYKVLPKRRIHIFTALVSAMLAGRLVWGAVMVIFTGLSGSAFGWAAFISSAFVKAIPGIILQLLLIPLLVMAINRSAFRERKSDK